MRWDTPLQMFERWVLEDSEICGATVPKGAELGLLFGSANRDPAVFDRPDDLDVGRDPNPHVSFGAGVHFCLGAPLARLELETSFATVLRRLPHAAARRGAGLETELHHPGPARAPRGRLSAHGAPSAVATSIESRRSDSNRRPSDYKSLALPDCATPAGRSESTLTACRGRRRGCARST